MSFKYWFRSIRIKLFIILVIAFLIIATWFMAGAISRILSPENIGHFIKAINEASR